MKRRILAPLLKDLQKKMVWVAGPRQAGKTTLAKQALKIRSGVYYSWDLERDRRILREGAMDPDAKLWVFDEIHKFPRWRNWLKGHFDDARDRHSFLVTGSARLDLFGRGGDSLQGRYYFHRLHPLTLSESLEVPWAGSLERIPEIPLAPSLVATRCLADLVKLGGFPEPFLSGSAVEAARWRSTYGSRLVREDIRDLQRVRELDQLELLFERLPQTVGSPLSLNSLREDLETSHATVKNWVQILERLYAVFRVAPFGASRIKAVKKETKLYFWDWARVTDEPSRFENLVALHLLRLCHWGEDMEGAKIELRYFRDTLGREVDFILLQNGKPWMAIEVKSDDRPLDSNLKYLLERVKIPFAFQLALNGKKDFVAPPINGCRVRLMPAVRFLAQIP